MNHKSAFKTKRVPRLGRQRLLLVWSVVLITGSAILLASTPAGRWLEESIGLAWLYQLRGPRPAPREVVVVSIDQYSSHRLKLPDKPRKWPRSLHGQLVDKLRQDGAAAIAFDIIFDEVRNPADDRRFARAIRRANDVVLFQYLKQETHEHNLVRVEKLVDPIAPLKHSAFALSPFPLPKLPAKVDHFLLYKPDLERPTIPLTMLQLYCLDEYPALLAMLHHYVPSQLGGLPDSAQQIRKQHQLPQVIRHLRRLFASTPSLAKNLLDELPHAELTPAARHKLAALIHAYAAPFSEYLNLYGGPRSITTIPYVDVLRKPRPDLRGKAVFVGFSEDFQPDQKDNFYTVFSNPRNGLDISGVELMATAFANLLQYNTLQVTSGGQDVAILLLWTILLVLILSRFPGHWQVPVALGIGMLYGLGVYYAFSIYDYWLPFTIPLLWQLPLVTLSVLLLSHRHLQRERQHIREAFGYHLPATVVDHIARGLSPAQASGEHMFGIVLASDAAQYTALSERLPAAELHQLMNAYYEVLFAPIRHYGGIISDVQGDAALAIWPAVHNLPEARHHACLAALAAHKAIEDFNAQRDTPLPTRLGLHCGEIILGHVGALDHFEYRAVGDIVNSASRLEGLNKQLGTSILASDAVINDLPELHCRALGKFRLSGKQHPIAVYEVLAADAPPPDFAPFDQALHAFQAQQWHTAQQLFTQCLQQQPDDGPSRFYLEQCSRYLQDTSLSWDGAITLTRK